MARVQASLCDLSRSDRHRWARTAGRHDDRLALRIALLAEAEPIAFQLEEESLRAFVAGLHRAPAALRRDLQAEAEEAAAVSLRRYRLGGLDDEDLVAATAAPAADRDSARKCTTFVLRCEAGDVVH